MSAELGDGNNEEGPCRENLRIILARALTDPDFSPRRRFQYESAQCPSLGSVSHDGDIQQASGPVQGSAFTLAGQVLDDFDRYLMTPGIR